MKKVLALILILMTVHGHAQIERDKALHFVGGNLFGLAGAGIAKHLSDGNRFWTFAGAVGGATLIGLGKEAVDAGQRENGWDNDDLLATVLGGVTVGVTIDLFTDHKGKRKRKQKEDVNPEITFQYIDGMNHKFFGVQDTSLPSIASFGLSQHVMQSLE